MSQPPHESPDRTPAQAAAHIASLEAELADLRQRLSGAQALGRVVQATASAHNLDGALTITCAELAALFSVPQVALALFEPGHNRMRVVAEYCAPGGTSGLGELIPVTGNPITEYVIEHLRPMVVPDAQNDERLGPVRDLMRRRGTASIMIVPVVIGGEVIGTLGIDAVERRDFSATEVALAGDIALALSQALANARLYESAQRELEERRRAEERIREQAATLAELSTPIIPVTAETLVLPLIGAVDTARAQQVLEGLLTGVAEHQAETVIIDITGLPLIDTHVADVLLRAARAIRLLGAEAIITGIRPEVAQTLVSLGVDLGTLSTYSTLQRGIADALRRDTRR